MLWFSGLGSYTPHANMDAGDYTVQVELPSHAKLTDFKVVLNEQCELPVACGMGCFLPHEWAELLANESRISPDHIAFHEKRGATMAAEDDDDENTGNYHVAWLSLTADSSPVQISFPGTPNYSTTY